MHEEEEANTPATGFDALATLHQRMKHNSKVIKGEEEKLSPDTDKRRFKCDQCDRSYKAREYLIKHQRIKHPLVKREEGVNATFRETPQKLEEPLECHQCGQICMTERDLGRHQCINHNMVKYEEEKTDVTVKEAPHELKTPLSSKTHVKRWREAWEGIESECNQCGERFSSKAKLRVHMAIHKGRKMLECNYCDEKFLTETPLIVHERIHTGERPFKCDLCGRRFINVSKLYVHKRKNHKHCGIFTCGNCGCKFQTKNRLRAHQIWCFRLGLTGNTGKDQPEAQEELPGHTAFTCDECGKGFVGQRQLFMHQYMHRERKPQKCKYCGVEFASTSSLEEHERGHDEKRPYSCTLCKWTSPRLGNLRLHYLRQHPGQKDNSFALDDKPHKCEYCGKGFTSQCVLGKHIYAHIEKPFKCNACGSGFIRETRFLQHQSICGITYFRCRHCGNNFLKRDRFLEHQNYCNERNEDGDKPGEFCDKSFLDSSGLRVHKCTDLSTEKTFTCKDCGTVVKVGVTALSNVFTVANISNVKCFINNHTLI